MIADYMSKPLQGKKFKKFQKNITNSSSVEQQECVGRKNNGGKTRLKTTRIN